LVGSQLKANKKINHGLIQGNIFTPEILGTVIVPFSEKYKHLKIKLENWHLITESQPEKKNKPLPFSNLSILKKRTKLEKSVFVLLP